MSDTFPIPQIAIIFVGLPQRASYLEIFMK